MHMPLIKSGKYWVNWANSHARNSTAIDDLEDSFRTNVMAFTQALEVAGASIVVESTRRDAKRAYLFHWSWQIAQHKVNTSDVPPMDGVDIEWDHGNDKASVKGADEMVAGFGLAVPPLSQVAPSLTSNHIIGKAIDMQITWRGRIVVANADGTPVEVTYMDDVNANVALHEVGASYGVRKHTADAPHWSYNGR